MNTDNSSIDNILKSSGGKISRKDLEQAAASGDATNLINNLSNKEKEKLNSILNDKTQLEKVMKSPGAQMLLKIFGGKNG